MSDKFIVVSLTNINKIKTKRLLLTTYGLFRLKRKKRFCFDKKI